MMNINLFSTGFESSEFEDGDEDESTVIECNSWLFRSCKPFHQRINLMFEFFRSKCCRWMGKIRVWG